MSGAVIISSAPRINFSSHYDVCLPVLSLPPVNKSIAKQTLAEVLKEYGYSTSAFGKWQNTPATMSDVGLASWLFNLYIDSREQYPVGHRLHA